MNPLKYHHNRGMIEVRNDLESHQNIYLMMGLKRQLLPGCLISVSFSVIASEIRILSCIPRCNFLEARLLNEKLEHLDHQMKKLTSSNQHF